jgi:hypothetical protein
MNGWEFQNGICFSSGNSNGNASTKCSDYSWSGWNSSNVKAGLVNWVHTCDVSDTPNYIKK